MQPCAVSEIDRAYAMTRSELVQSLAQKFPQLTSKDAELAVAEIVDAIQRALTSGGRVEIRGFGSFGLNYRPPRTGRNPKTGKQVLVPGKYSPHFKAGKELRERIDQPPQLVEDARQRKVA